MRRLATWSLMGALLVSVGCGGGEETKPDETPVETAVETAAETPAMSNMEVLKKGIEAFNAGDMEASKALWTDDAKWTAVGAPEMMSASGSEGVHKIMFGMFRAIYPDAKVGVTRVFDGGDVAIYQGVFSGTNTGDFPDGTTATNKKASNNFAHIVRFADGKVKSIDAYSNGLTERMQLGLMEPMPGAGVPALAPMPAGEPPMIAAAANDKLLGTWKNAVNLWGNKKWDKLAGVMTEDVMGIDYGNNTAVKGPAKVQEIAEKMNFATWDFVSHDVNESWTFGDTLVATGTFTMNMARDMGPMKADKQNHTMQALEIVNFKDGKIAAYTIYTNPMGMMMKMMPPKQASR